MIKKVCLLGEGRSQKAQIIKRCVCAMSDDVLISATGTEVTQKSTAYETVIGGAPWDVIIALLKGDILCQNNYSRLHPV
jgi:hypothetical protein